MVSGHGDDVDIVVTKLVCIVCVCSVVTISCDCDWCRLAISQSIQRVKEAGEESEMGSGREGEGRLGFLIHASIPSCINE